MIDYIKSFSFFGVFIGILVASAFAEWMFRRFYVRLIHRSTLAMNNDPTNYRFMGQLISAIIYLVGLILAIREVPPLRSIASSLLTGAGILAVIIGFASQQALNNVLSGFFIVLFKPFRVNDRLRIRKDYFGVVEDITLRHTIIRDPENRRIIIPNSVINAEILINADFNDNKVCRFIEFNLSTDTDIDRAKEIMREEVKNHPTSVDVRTEQQKLDGAPAVVVRVVAILPYGITVRANAWGPDNQDSYVMYCDLLESIKKRFDAEGIKLPMIYYIPKENTKEEL